MFCSRCSQEEKCQLPEVVRKSPGEYHVASLIDFKTSGVFPEYWEYITAKDPGYYGEPYYWNDEVDKFLPPYSEEFEWIDSDFNLVGQVLSPS
jgi:hypothetical protein